MVHLGQCGRYTGLPQGLPIPRTAQLVIHPAKVERVSKVLRNVVDGVINGKGPREVQRVRSGGHSTPNLIARNQTRGARSLPVSARMPPGARHLLMSRLIILPARLSQVHRAQMMLLVLPSILDLYPRAPPPLQIHAEYQVLVNLFQDPAKTTRKSKWIRSPPAVTAAIKLILDSRPMAACSVASVSSSVS